MTALFQRIMTEMLSGIDGVGVYVDDYHRDENI
jgi:hypothetical protein